MNDRLRNRLARLEGLERGRELSEMVALRVAGRPVADVRLEYIGLMLDLLNHRVLPAVTRSQLQSAIDRFEQLNAGESSG